MLDRITIIKEYVNYCSDLNLDLSKRSSKQKFSNDYTEMLYNLSSIIFSEIEQTNKLVYSTLLYNNLTIHKLAESGE